MRNKVWIIIRLICSIVLLQILELLGPVANTRVVELGAGIGRFTAEFAKTAKQVSAYDFMENLTEANKANNGHLNNVKISQQDVTTMELAPDSCDVVFSNWLLMYLSDDEVGTFAQKTLSWVSLDRLPSISLQQLNCSFV